MKTLVAFVVLVSAPALALDDERTFVERITTIGRTHDAAQWRTLFCEARNESDADTRVLKYFTSASLSASKLSVCYEPPSSKEMCMVFAVTRNAGNLCLAQ